MLVSSNQVRFADAWDNVKSVAVRYTLKHHSFSQDPLISDPNALPDPALYGFTNTANVILEGLGRRSLKNCCKLCPGRGCGRALAPRCPSC